MPQTRMRFGVTSKVVLGLALITAVGISAMLVIYRGLERVETSLERLAAVKAPIIAAAFGMEVNVNGAALYALTYAAARRPEYRTEAEDDVADFAAYHATYVSLVATARERELATEIAEQHGDFTALARNLMDLADRQEQLYRAIAEQTEEVDYLLEGGLQSVRLREAPMADAEMGFVVAGVHLEAETAQVGQWAANYHREPALATRRTILERLDTMERALRDVLGFDAHLLGPEPAARLQELVSSVEIEVREVIVLEDQILAGRDRLIGLRESMDDLLDEEIQILAVLGLDEPRADAKSAADAVLVATQFLVPGFLLVAGIIGFLLIHVIRAPLGRLNLGTRAVMGGDLTYRIAPNANDEFGDLAMQYNKMVEQLQATTVTRDRLEQSEAMLRQTVQKLRHEIAEREALQAELRRSETMSAMGALVAGVAHEVRNPLFGISSTLDALTARLGEQTHYRRYITILQEQVGRLGKLMADLLTYGRPPSSNFSVASPNSILAPAFESCADLARERDVRVELRPDPELASVRMDRDRMVLALRNLIDNAVRHAPAGSAITVTTSGSVEEGRSFVTLSVRDAGPGFQSEDLPKVFEPFFTRRQGGTGLGLALVQRIALEHGGETIARNAENGGAVVSIRLPVAHP